MPSFKEDKTVKDEKRAWEVTIGWTDRRAKAKTQVGNKMVDMPFRLKEIDALFTADQLKTVYAYFFAVQARQMGCTVGQITTTISEFPFDSLDPDVKSNDPKHMADYKPPRGVTWPKPKEP